MRYRTLYSTPLPWPAARQRRRERLLWLLWFLLLAVAALLTLGHVGLRRKNDLEIITKSPQRPPHRPPTEGRRCPTIAPGQQRGEFARRASAANVAVHRTPRMQASQPMHRRVYRPKS